jgi:hypothetical protein
MATKSLSMEEKPPELFTKDLDINKRDGKRTTPMEVLSLGMPRTGTACTNFSYLNPPLLTTKTAMQIALQILGIPTFHSFDLYTNTRASCALWATALNAKYSPPEKPTILWSRDDWDKVLGHYGAVCDVPAIAFAEDLITAYPEAKIILVERDIERWYKSFDEAVIPHVYSPILPLIARFDPYFVGPLVRLHQGWAKGWMKSYSADEMRANARGMFREHYEMVKRVTEPERLLVFEMSEGWEPLCRFLGKEVPDVEFPRVNDTDALNATMRMVAWRGVKNGAKRAFMVLMPFVVVGGAWLYLRD